VRAIVPPRTSYWRAGALAGLVGLGWAWDAALGGGRSHALAWCVAVVVVAGVAALAVHGARLAGDTAAVPGDEAAGPPDDRQIRLAERADLVSLPELERSADTMFRVAGYGDVGEPASLACLARAAAVLVAGTPPIGFAWIELVGEQAHLQGLSVALRRQRRGVGSALIEAACDWALAAGCSRITLTTFADVPWNAPFFTRRGFAVLAGPGDRGTLADPLAELWQADLALFPGAADRRVLLSRRLG
jgi:GNAT superfamily N-acetyltransferase